MVEAQKDLKMVLRVHLSGMSYRDIGADMFRCGYNLSQYQICRLARSIPEIKVDYVPCGWGISYAWFELKGEIGKK
jgi:hypothetical protein